MVAAALGLPPLARIEQHTPYSVRDEQFPQENQTRNSGSGLCLSRRSAYDAAEGFALRLSKAASAFDTASPARACTRHSRRELLRGHVRRSPRRPVRGYRAAVEPRSRCRTRAIRRLAPSGPKQWRDQRGTRTTRGLGCGCSRQPLYRRPYKPEHPTGHRGWNDLRSREAPMVTRVTAGRPYKPRGRRRGQHHLGLIPKSEG